MCGRFTLHHSTSQVLERFGADQATVDLRPRYNIAPSQPVAVVVGRQQRMLEAFKWGLVPSWAKDPKIAIDLIGYLFNNSDLWASKTSRTSCKVLICQIYDILSTNLIGKESFGQSEKDIYVVFLIKRAISRAQAPHLPALRSYLLPAPYTGNNVPGSPQRPL